MQQVITLIAISAVMFIVIGGISLIAHYYTLNGIKSKTVGDGQHGTAHVGLSSCENSAKKKSYKPICTSRLMFPIGGRGSTFPNSKGWSSAALAAKARSLALWTQAMFICQ